MSDISKSDFSLLKRILSLSVRVNIEMSDISKIMTDIYYHIYNRGAHKALVFNDGNDYQRMLKLLYIANNTESFVIGNLGKKDIFTIERKDTLVDIVAYCLMPNHFHVAVKKKTLDVGHLDTTDAQVTKFMRKLCTGYSAYYNSKYDHSGTLWQGKYKSKTVYNKDYIQTLISYIHLNPFGIKEPDMTKEAKTEHLEEAIEYSMKYEYSSFRDYLGENRQQTVILNREAFIDVRHLENELQLDPCST